MISEPINLLNFDRTSLRSYFQSLGEKPFHADQIIQWIHHFGMSSFEAMTNLSKNLRAHLDKLARIEPPKLVSELISIDGTRKWLLEFEDGIRVETVFIPEEDRGTLCISSQAGCALACAFCATGQLGCQRNLLISEMIGQVWFAVRRLSQADGRHDQTITNVVFMGMGEPLLNFDNVVKTADLLMDDLAYGLSKYRVTVSTVGLVPEMKKLSQLSQASLALSLHAPDDKLRDQLIPMNRKYPLSEIMAVCKSYFINPTQRKITMEYIMLQGVNDSLQQAKMLVKLLEGIPCKVNLIPYNSVPNLPFQPSTEASIRAFQEILVNAGLNTRTRKRRGDDIKAACGQLVGVRSQGPGIED